MSYASLSAQYADSDFQARVLAATQKEAWNNPTFGDTDYGALVKANKTGNQAVIWPCCIDTEAAYEAALLNNVPRPGLDPSVVTDGQILSAIQTSWPPDPYPPQP